MLAVGPPERDRELTPTEPLPTLGVPPGPRERELGPMGPMPAAGPTERGRELTPTEPLAALSPEAFALDRAPTAPLPALGSARVSRALREAQREELELVSGPAEAIVGWPGSCARAFVLGHDAPRGQVALVVGESCFKLDRAEAHAWWPGGGRPSEDELVWLGEGAEFEVGARVVVSGRRVIADPGGALWSALGSGELGPALVPPPWVAQSLGGASARAERASRAWAGDELGALEGVPAPVGIATGSAGLSAERLAVMAAGVERSVGGGEYHAFGSGLWLPGRVLLPKYGVVRAADPELGLVVVHAVLEHEGAQRSIIVGVDTSISPVFDDRGPKLRLADASSARVGDLAELAVGALQLVDERRVGLDRTRADQEVARQDAVSPTRVSPRRLAPRFREYDLGEDFEI